MANRKKSPPIWSFYSVAEDSRFTKFNVCKQEISCSGKTTKMFSTSNLVSHLKYKHKPEYERIPEEEINESSQLTVSTSNSDGARQLTLAQSYDKSRLWDIND